MVPVCWALASADVSAGTASAARIAIIAITTSNSINVKALKRSRCFGILNSKEGLFIRVFIGVFFSFYGCSEGFAQKGFCLVLGLFVGGWGGCFGGLVCSGGNT